MKKRYSIPLFTLIALPLGLYLSLKLPVFGGQPSTDDALRFSDSIAFNQTDGSFENRRPELVEKMRAEMSLWTMLQELFKDREDAIPSTKLPAIMPNFAEFVKASENTKLIWLGHSSFLLNIANTMVLVDPVFSENAAPVSFLVPRFQPAVVSMEQLPEIDIVLISHDHYDHLDKKSVEFFTDRPTQFLTPFGVGAHLQRWGVALDNIIEKDWWTSHVFNGVEFTAAPAQHFSGRDGITNNKTLWASWIITSDQSRLYYSGDSGYDTHFKEVGERYGPFDLSIMENGQYDTAWAAVHMFPQETVRAHKDLDAKRLMPVHWGMFELAYHTWYDPAEQLSIAADAQAVELMTPIMGEIMVLDDDIETKRWWQELM